MEDKSCASCKDLRIRMQMMLDDIASGACCADKEYDDEPETNEVRLSIPSKHEKLEDINNFKSLLGIDI